MINRENKQEKIKNSALENLNKATPQPGQYDPKDIRNLIGLFETVAVAPIGFPKTFWQSIKIYENGATFRLYIYSQTSKTWRYVALT